VRPGQVLFNFQDADLQAVIKTISQLTGRNFLIDPRVKGRITVVSARPVSTAAAYQIFLSALKAQGFTAVAGPGGVVKVLPEAEGKQSATVSGAAGPRGGDQLITQVLPVQNGSAAQMLPILRPLMAPSGVLSIYAPANTLIITDYASNVRRLLQVVERLDQAESADVTIVALEHASALDMAQLLGRLAEGSPVQPGQPQPAGGADTGRLSIVPDLRTNSLLVRTDNPGRLERLRDLIQRLDVPARQGGNTRVIYLRNAEAAKLAEVLRGLLAGEARSQTAATAVPAVAGAAGARATAPASLIQADEASNALVISAPDAVYNNLRAVIEKLDVRRAQVFVEALIAEVTVDRAAQFGVQWAGAGEVGDGTLGGVQNFPLTGSSIVQTAISPETSIGAGLTIGYIGPEIDLPGVGTVVGLGALARALNTDSSTNILSTPNLLTLDNAEATIHVGQNVPFVTGSFTQAGAGTVTGVNPFQTIERQDVGVKLRIKPQISEGGAIRLEIEQEVSNVVGAVSGAQDIVTNKRSLKTVVVVDSGATIVLGGLIEDNVREREQAVPLLGRIPLLGGLFRYRERLKTKTNLMVFLRPVVVRSAQDSVSFTADRYEYMRAQQEATQVKPSLILPRYSAPVMPPLVPFDEPAPAPAPQGTAPDSEKLGPPDGADDTAGAPTPAP
jgi:general secretion pathway protein D